MAGLFGASSTKIARCGCAAHPGTGDRDQATISEAREAAIGRNAREPEGPGAAVLHIFVPRVRGILGDSAINVPRNAQRTGCGRAPELEGDRLGIQYLARPVYHLLAMAAAVPVLMNQELFDAEVAQQEGRQPRRGDRL